MKRVLIAPLDWGLGHAARCVPVIRELKLQGCEVFIAGSGDSLVLLQREFPHLRAFGLPAYRPRYPRNGSMVWTMALQLPRFLKVISDEHRAVEGIIRQEKIDLLISDNRYGCWSSHIPAVFITHQSNIMMPRRFGWLQDLVRRLNEQMMRRFSVCWVPDFPDKHSLAGELMLSGMPDLKIQTRFIGWLSRFERRESRLRKYDVVAILSGPEPQRTSLENIVMPQLKNSANSYRVVRGLPSLRLSPADDHAVNFLDSKDLQTCIESADLIIARSGYSTVMDLHALGKKAVFVPTPGQTEQEYLARRLKEKGIAFSMAQDKFDLKEALLQSENYSGFEPLSPDSRLREAVRSILI